MFRDREEELSRLEEALLEQEAEEPEEEHEEEPEETPEPAESFDAYINQPADVDLEEYSEEVLEEPKKISSGLLAFFLIVSTVLFCILLFLILKFKGVLG